MSAEAGPGRPGDPGVFAPGGARLICVTSAARRRAKAGAGRNRGGPDGQNRFHQRAGNPRFARQSDSAGAARSRRRDGRQLVRSLRRLDRRVRGGRAARRRQEALRRQGRAQGGGQRRRQDRAGGDRPRRGPSGRNRRGDDRARRHPQQGGARRQRHARRVDGGGAGGRGTRPSSRSTLISAASAPRAFRCR